MVYHIPQGEVMLAGIRDKARETLLLRGIDLRALMEDAEGGPSTGRVVDRRFFATLEKVGGMMLSDEEKAFVLRRFGDHRRIIDYAKFYHAVDIYLPRSHTNPDHFFDPLPQPYRRVMKVLEEDILERAWRLIGERHPDVVHTLYAKEVDYFKQDLQQECQPSSWVEDEFGPVTALAVDSATSSLFVGTSTGRVLVVSTDIGRISSTLAPFSDMAGAVRGLSLSGLIPAPPPPPGLDILDVSSDPSLIVAAFIHQQQQPTSPPPQVDPSGISRSKQGGTEAAPAPPTAASKDKKKKDDGAVVVEPPPASRLALLHVSRQTARAFASLQTKVPVQSAILSRDGAFLAVITTDGALAVHKVPPTSEATEEGEIMSSVSMAKIAEMDELVFRIADKLTDIPPPFFTLPASNGPPAPSSAEAPSPPLVTVHFMLADPPPGLSPLDTTGRRLLRKEPVTSGLLLWRAGSDRLHRYDFIKPLPPPPADPPAADAKGKKGAPPPEPPPPPPTIAARSVGECVLPSPITVSCMDASTYMLVLGLRSGTVLFWDLHVGGLREALGRHEGPVTALAISHNKYIISGATDLRVHVYDLSPDASNQDTASSVEMREMYGLRVPRLLGYREDFKTPLVAIYTFDDMPLALMQDTDGTVCVFDLLHAAPLGQLCKPPDMDFLLREADTDSAMAVGSSSSTNDPAASAAGAGEAAAPPAATTVTGSQANNGSKEVLLGFSSGLAVAAYVSKASKAPPTQHVRPETPSAAGGPDGAEPSTVDGQQEPVGGEKRRAARLALFTTVQLVRGLCPAIASIPEAVQHGEVKNLFHMMPPDVRRRTQAPPEYVARFMPPPAQVAATKSLASRSVASSRRSPAHSTHNRMASTGGSLRSPAAVASVRSPGGRQGSVRSPLSGGSPGPSPKGGGHARVFSFSSADVKLRSGPGGRSPIASSSSSFRISRHSSSRTQPAAGGTGALTKENLSMMFGSTGVDVIRGVPACRYMDPDEAVNRLKANRNANKEDRDGRVMDALQELMTRLQN